MLIGKEVDNFFQEKGANKSCPRWSLPQGKYWAWFCDGSNGLKLDENGFSCTGQESITKDLNPLCQGCPVKGVIFPEVTSHNYLQVLCHFPKG